MVLCQVCAKAEAKYKCPRCGHATCSVACVKAHKATASCSGKRDRTAYVDVSAFTENNLVSDISLLEEAGTAANARVKIDLRRVPQHLKSMQRLAQRKGIRLSIMPPVMTKRKENTTHMDRTSQRFFWHVVFSFPGQDCVVPLDHVDEQESLESILRQRILDPTLMQPWRSSLRTVAGCPMEELVVLLKRDRIPQGCLPFVRMRSMQQSLLQCLQGLEIVEYPTFVVLLPQRVVDYPHDEQVEFKTSADAHPCSEESDAEGEAEADAGESVVVVDGSEPELSEQQIQALISALNADFGADAQVADRDVRENVSAESFIGSNTDVQVSAPSPSASTAVASCATTEIDHAPGGLGLGLVAYDLSDESDDDGPVEQPIAKCRRANE